MSVNAVLGGPQHPIGAGVRNILRWAPPALAAVVLAAVIWRLGSGPLLDGVRALDARALLAAAAIFLLTTVCCAWRWTIVARGLGVCISLPAAVAAYYRCLFLNVMLPSGVAGDVHRGVMHGREVHDVGLALRAVVWERTAGQIVQVVLTISVLFVLPSPLRSSMPFVAAALVTTAVVVALVVRAQPRRRSRWERLRNAVVADIRGGLLRKGALPAVALLSTVAVLGHAATFLIAARAVGVTAPLSTLLPLAFISLMAMVLPSIGGWGPREGVTAWVFSAAALGADRGAATAIAYGVMVLAATLPGGLVLVAEWLHRRPASRSGHAGTSSSNHNEPTMGERPDMQQIRDRTVIDRMHAQ
jgi:glycosyltransferase 2 family protein